MSFSQATASPFWFPDSVLLCALLRVRPRWWWLLLAGTLPIRFLSEVASAVPFGLLLGTMLNDWVKGIIGAALLKRLIADPIRFASVRDIGIYCLIAVLAVPAASAFAGAASRSGLGHEYSTNWEQWFLGNAMTHLIVPPFVFYWVLRPVTQRNLSSAQWLEALLLATGLLVSLTHAFEPAVNQLGFADSRLYAPVAFLFWAAVRFGMRGATAATAASDAGRGARIERTDARRRCGLVEVSVSDNGCGIPAGQLADLFDSFFTTKPEGMGVGLSIARSIVLAHGGRIWAANREGCSAVFRFTLRTAAADTQLTTDSGK